VLVLVSVMLAVMVWHHCSSSPDAVNQDVRKERKNGATMGQERTEEADAVDCLTLVVGFELDGDGKVSGNHDDL